MTQDIQTKGESIAHEGHEYTRLRDMPEADRPREGDKIAMLLDADDPARTGVLTGPVVIDVGGRLRVGGFIVNRGRHVRIIERAPEPLPEGGIVIVTDTDGTERVYWHRDGLVSVNRDDAVGRTVEWYRAAGCTVRPATLADLRGEHCDRPSDRI